MLVLSRKKGQEIVINDNIYIHILDINNDHIKIGVTAPLNCSVHRREIYEIIKNVNIDASKSNLEDMLNLEKEIKKHNKENKNARK